jgi:glycosyltransferase involved in cell wall biosynthesis
MCTENASSRSQARTAVIQMQIGIDGCCWTHRRGYGRFLRELLPALGRADSVHSYHVYLDSSSYPEFDLGPPFIAHQATTQKGVIQSATETSHRSLRDIAAMSRSVRQPLDLFFFPSVYSYFPLLRRIPVLVAIHDTIADRNPRFAFSSKKQEWLWRLKVRAALAQADTIVTVSEHSRRSIAEWFHVPASRIAVIQEAASSVFQPGSYPPPHRPFALYAGGISPNKNLPSLIRSFARTGARLRGAQLILAGDYESDQFKGNYAEVRSLITELDLENDVILTGLVSDSELCRLYNTCTVFVMPSLDEGFGLPAVEAMSCGRAVIVSRGTSLEEVTADAGILVDPQSIEQISDAIDRVFSDEQLRCSLGERALRRANEFSWDQSARQLLGVCEETYARSHGSPVRG